MFWTVPKKKPRFVGGHGDRQISETWIPQALARRRIQSRDNVNGNDSNPSFNLRRHVLTREAGPKGSVNNEFASLEVMALWKWTNNVHSSATTSEHCCRDSPVCSVRAGTGEHSDSSSTHSLKEAANSKSNNHPGTPD
jgi:hypothetical protein